jgi:hypothetical protein
MTKRPLPVLSSEAPTEQPPLMFQTADDVHVPGPVESALASLWREESARLYRVRNLWTLWRLRRRFSLRLLRASALRVAVPRGQVPDCESCLDLCCTGPHAVVSLRLRDIARLHDRGLTHHITFERPPWTPTNPSVNTWARREAEGSIFARAFPVLTRDATGTCGFLTTDRTCGLWPAWPLSCARYPYALDLQAGVVFYAKGCKSTVMAPFDEAPARTRALVSAVVEAYNARIRDVILLAVARPRLASLGLLAHIKVDELGF